MFLQLLAREGSPDFGTGVILDIFQSSNTTLWDREQLNKVVSVGEVESAVPRSTALEMPSGPLAVLALKVDNKWKTSSSEHVMLERAVYNHWTGGLTLKVIFNKTHALACRAA